MPQQFGALALAQQIFAAEPTGERRELFVLSDMRESMPELDFDAPDAVPPFPALAVRCGTLPDLRSVEVYVLGVDGAGRSTSQWQSVQIFWRGYFESTRAELKEYSALREVLQVP